MEFKRRRELKRPKIEIIPMIDTMFFLLVFFMLSSLALTKLKGLPVNLPKAATASKVSTLDMTVTIDKQKNVFLNRSRITLDTLGDSIRQITGHGDLSQASLVINADEGVPYGLIVKAMDQARAVGVTHFPLATNPESAKG